MDSADSENSKIIRMSFLFPQEFYELLLFLKNETGKDMTYLIMEAVNNYVKRKIESASVAL